MFVDGRSDGRIDESDVSLLPLKLEKEGEKWILPAEWEEEDFCSLSLIPISVLHSCERSARRRFPSFPRPFALFFYLLPRKE